MFSPFKAHSCGRRARSLTNYTFTDFSHSYPFEGWQIPYRDNCTFAKTESALLLGQLSRSNINQGNPPSQRVFQESEQLRFLNWLSRSNVSFYCLSAGSLIG